MTHDELLEEIDDRFSDTCDAHCESCSTKNFPIKAIRAVVELHKPEEFENGPDDYKLVCSHCQLGVIGEVYPCETIEAIEKELA